MKNLRNDNGLYSLTMCDTTNKIAVIEYIRNVMCEENYSEYEKNEWTEKALKADINEVIIFALEKLDILNR